MKNECNIIRDILPLYVENMASPDTIEFVENHLKTCAECRKEYDQLKKPDMNFVQRDTSLLMSLKRKMRMRKIQTIVFTAIFVMVLLVTAFAFASAPEYFPYSDDLLSTAKNSDNSITITFDEKVRNYKVTHYNASLDSMDKKARSRYSVEAWTSYWDRMFPSRGVQTTIIKPEKDVPFTVYYVSNSNELDVVVFGPPLSVNGGQLTLPRLALVYYLKLALVCFIVLLMTWFIFRRKTNIQIWIERILLYPLSYVIAHVAVMGPTTISYSMQRDLTLIFLLSILIYCCLLLAHNIYRLRAEIKSIHTK